MYLRLVVLSVQHAVRVTKIFSQSTILFRQWQFSIHTSPQTYRVRLCAVVSCCARRSFLLHALDSIFFQKCKINIFFIFFRIILIDTTEYNGLHSCLFILCLSVISRSSLMCLCHIIIKIQIERTNPPRISRNTDSFNVTIH